MDVNSWGWIGLILILFVSSFGVLWCVGLIASVVVFAAGLISLLYIQAGDIDRYYKKCVANPLTIEKISDGGLNQVIRQMTTPRKENRTDNRVTGSDLIDSSLQEILGYIIRDYVTPWYSLISMDNEFSDITVKRTAQTLAINISNRVKEIDWIPYLTTRLVDDAASHLRLFKQALAKTTFIEKKSPRNSPHKSQSPKRAHKRNKSETDIWHYGIKNVDFREPEKIVGSSKFYVADSKGSGNRLENFFFDLECQMEDNKICRDAVCTDLANEKEFLSELVELLLYVLLPDEDFHCRPLRFILRELMANSVILPLFMMLSDPDFINQAIIWLCLREATLPSEIFITTLRLAENCDELKATKELVSKEIQTLRSRDSGGESDLSIKQQLNSLIYVLKLVNNRILKLEKNYPDSVNGSSESLPLDTVKTVDLPLDVILRDNVALSYFIDYVCSQGKQAYIYLYFNIDGWKTSVEQQLSNLHLNQTKSVQEINSVYETIRYTAISMFDEYLSDKSKHKLELKPTLIQDLYFKIKNLSKPPTEVWFDDVQNEIYQKFKTQEEFLTGFKKSRAYLKLLEELELVQQNIVDEDNISLNSLENLEVGSDESVPQKQQQSIKITQNENFLCVESENKGMKHVRSLSDVTYLAAKSEIKSAVESQGIANGKAQVPKVSPIEINAEKLKSDNFDLSVTIIETGVVSEKGKTFGVYALRVGVKYDTGYNLEWHIYRRYSDFHDLHTKIKDKYPDLSKIAFPGKKTFHNMDRAVLERRKRMLGDYMCELCQTSVLTSHVGLRSLLMAFLEQGEYDRAALGGVSSTFDSLVNPLKSGMRSIKNMPEQLINTVDEVVEGISKVFHSKSGQTQEASKVGASIDIESDDNIPLRIMLLLMDEVFDLKSRNQWLRRRIVTFLRQIVRTMFGDIVNRRILDYVSFITSPKNVAHYLHLFKHSYWPNGVKAERKPERDTETKARTRTAAKVALLSCLSDELKHIIGSETTRRGLLTVFELFQRPVLNRRLLYVTLEGVLYTLFPEKPMVEIFQKLHSKSRRIQDLQKNTQKTR